MRGQELRQFSIVREITLVKVLQGTAQYAMEPGTALDVRHGY